MPDIQHLSEKDLQRGRTLFELRADGSVRTSHFDTATTLFLREELTRIETEVVAEDFEPLDGLELCPLETDLRLGDKYVKWKRMSSSGKAEFATGADTDVALVDLGATPQETRAHFLGVGYQVDIEELEAAADHNIALDSEGAMLCRQALLERINYAILDGVPEKEIQGFFGDSALKGNEVTAITATSDADTDLTTLNACVNALATASKNAIRPDTLALPLSIHDIVATKRLPDSTRTVLEQFLMASPYIRTMEQVMALPSLEATSDERARFVVFRKDRSVVRCKILAPRFWKILDTLYGHKVVWIAKMTDVNWKRPLGGRIYRFPAS